MSVFQFSRQLSVLASNVVKSTVLRAPSQLTTRVQSSPLCSTSKTNNYCSLWNGLSPYIKSASCILQKMNDCKLHFERFISLSYMHRKGLYKKVRKKKNSPLEGRPQLKGVVLKTLIKKPKKPNSANRKCVRLRLSTGREVTAYVPGEGHNLQEHNIVLVQGGKLQDTPGVKLVCVRGKYDLPHVKKK
ncbi:40S ribosomal protein S12, mitochondrial-like [Biomphalaria glabrata]|uniref:Small ribosomal subunit protein uS12m n=1 Tax=Biomphalaria glabrata TaxID=6526 RepID=A0A2C9JYM7_BIOGL|nr:40S ribosomal protein S12, mitochondrial-like [Biomphalaria glabrata]KAI8788051.1 40S ribosomal protein S12, mitochondrial [Biomphalaria glabrata]